MLALQDTIQKNAEEYALKERKHNERIEMRNFYDSQIKAKREKERNDYMEDQRDKLDLDHKVRTINAMCEQDNLNRIVKRGSVAMENLNAVNEAKQKEKTKKIIAKEIVSQGLNVADAEHHALVLMKKEQERIKKAEEKRQMQNSIEKKHQI